MDACKRYTQPVIQTQPGPTFKIAEVPLFEDPKGKWVKWEDYERLQALVDRMLWSMQKKAEMDLLPRVRFEPSEQSCEPFIVKHYAGDDRPSIKGNGFDGLEIGEERWEAQAFIDWVNVRLGKSGACTCGCKMPDGHHHSCPLYRLGVN